MCYSDLTKETYLILVQESGSSIPLPEDFAGVRAHYICAPAKACKFSARSARTPVRVAVSLTPRCCRYCTEKGREGSVQIQLLPTTTTPLPPSVIEEGQMGP